MESQEAVQTRKKPGPKPKVKTSKVVKDQGSGPKIKWKGAFEFRHDLFKCQSAKMIKRKPSLITRAIPDFNDDLARVEHVHWYHTFNSQGRPLKFTDPVGGHYHEITWSVDENGDLVAECGPPIQDIHKRTKAGKQIKQKGIPVKYENQVGDVLVDDHVHDMEYVQSEVLTPSKRQSQLSAPQEELIKILKKEGITLREQ